MVIVKFWKPFLFGTFILAVCLVPSYSIEKIDLFKISFQDFIAHFIMFFIFSLLLARDFRRYSSFGNNKSRQMVFLFVFAIALSALTEILQYAFPLLNREANMGDFLFDLAGTGCGLLVFLFIN